MFAALPLTTGALSGDAAIYFTFIRNFFELPFSYQPGNVTFGATSPLHVVANAPLARALPDAWIEAARALNFLWLALAMECLSRVAGGGLATRLALAALTLGYAPLPTATSGLFETSLAYLGVAAICLGIRERSAFHLVAVAGLLPLVRPELALLAAVAYVAALRFRPSWQTIAFAAACLVPLLVYHVYLWGHTGRWMPSSAVARIGAFAERGDPWAARAAAAYGPWISAPDSWVVVAGTAALVAGSVFFERRLWVALAAPALAVLLPFLVVPPSGSNVARYLAPLAAPGSAAIAVLARPLLSRPVGLVLSASASAGALAYLAIHTPANADRDRLLLRDMGQRLNHLNRSRRPVFVYEIQGQYYLDSPCVSLDGLLDSRVPDAIASRTLPALLRESAPTYLVTMNSFVYRPLFAETLLPDIYLHDLRSEVGERFRAEGLVFTKVLTNPDFADPSRYRTEPFPALSRGSTLRLYGTVVGDWTGHHPFWNSVYEVRAE